MQTAARELYNLTVTMNSHFKRGSGDDALKAGDLGSDFDELILKYIDLANGVRDEIMRADFRNDDRAHELSDRLREIQKEVINALSKRGNKGTSGPLVTEVVVVKLQSIAEQIENVGVSSASVTTRQDMIKQTEELIAEVKTWEIEDYAKRTLLIQLNNVARVIQAADTYAASELRYFVKSIIADFAAEFTQMDKKHQTHLERLVRWGRCCVFAGTTFLGLTSDVVAITAALPSPPKLLGKI